MGLGAPPWGGERVTCHLLNTGWASAPEWVLVQGGSLSRRRVPVLVALIHHAREGWGLFDAGYAPRVHHASCRWPFVLYRRLAPMTLAAGGAVAAQLHGFGLTARHIRWVVVSHFHADHIGGLLDFPCARFIASRSAYDDVRSRRGVDALCRAFIPSLMPPDFETRATLLDEFEGAGTPALARTHDLFGDGTIRLSNLPGHARGQIGALVQAGDGDVFLLADGCWMSRSWRDNSAPHRITRVFVDSVEEAEQTVSAVHEYAGTHPNTRLVPSHCPEICARYVIRSGS